MYAYFAPGPLELLIILLILGLAVLAPLIALVVILAARKSGASRPAPAPCPNCGGWVVQQANFCHHCGAPLSPQEPH